MTNDAKIDLAFTLVKGVIELFKRHQQGENVTADLNELLTKVQTLKSKEQAIAAGSVGTGGGSTLPKPSTNVPPVNT